MTGGGGSGFERVSPPERIDACAGALITFRGATEELRAELDETRGRKLVWREERITIFGRATHRVDWNPALEYLAIALSEVDARISAEEVKNAVKLSTRNQLRDFLAYARATNRTFILWVRSNTTLVGELGNWEARGFIKVERVL